MRRYITAIMLIIPTVAFAQQAKNPSLELRNSGAVRAKSTITITANVTNRSKTDATDGTVVFDNEDASCTATFGAINKLGGSASGSCTLDGYALTAKAAFNAANGTHWVGIAGNGQAFEQIDIGLNDPK